MNVIINADDFGLTQELNTCVQYLYNRGIVLSATIMANGPFFDHAVSIAKSLPGLGVGVHLCLDGPYNINQNNSSLVNPVNGQFYDRFTVKKKLARFGFNPEDIYKEYDLQIRKVLDNGINITHIDHHHHFHLYYQSLKQIIKLSARYGIQCIRSQQILPDNQIQPLNRAYRIFHQSIVKRHFKTPDGYFVFLPSGNPIDSNFSRLRQLFSAQYSYVEIECHPNHMEDFDTRFLDDLLSNQLLKDHTIINYNGL
jgi:chitin disaccharide deacetylase